MIKEDPEKEFQQWVQKLDIFFNTKLFPAADHEKLIKTEMNRAI